MVAVAAAAAVMAADVAAAVAAAAATAAVAPIADDATKIPSLRGELASCVRLAFD